MHDAASKAKEDQQQFSQAKPKLAQLVSSSSSLKLKLLSATTKNQQHNLKLVTLRANAPPNLAKERAVRFCFSQNIASPALPERKPSKRSTRNNSMGRTLANFSESSAQATDRERDCNNKPKFAAYLALLLLLPPNSPLCPFDSLPYLAIVAAPKRTRTRSRRRRPRRVHHPDLRLGGVCGTGK